VTQNVSKVGQITKTKQSMTNWHHSAHCVEISTQSCLFSGRRGERKFWWNSGTRRRKKKDYRR